jgi:hypothetical protein
MMFRSITLLTTMSLLSTVVSTTAHAGENTAESDVATSAATAPGAVFTEAPVRRGKPKAGADRVAGEVLIGLAVGAGLSIGTGVAVYKASERADELDEDDDAWQSLGNAAAGVVFGAAAYPLGVGVGVGLAGNAGDVHGSYGASIGGAYLGSLGGALLGWSLGPDTWGGSAGLIGFLAGAPIGAVIGHSMTLEYDRPSTGLVNVSGNRTRMSIPAVSVTADPLRPQSTITSIRLMDGRF